MSNMLRTIVISTLMLTPSLAGAAENDWMNSVGEALGKPGTEMPGGVYRVALPRSDIHAKLDGVDIKTGLALGGWLAFQTHGQEAMVMGDLGLLSEEVPPAMTNLEQGGIEVPALHNHLFANDRFPLS